MFLEQIEVFLSETEATIIEQNYQNTRRPHANIICKVPTVLKLILHKATSVTLVESEYQQ